MEKGQGMKVERQNLSKGWDGDENIILEKDIRRENQSRSKDIVSRACWMLMDLQWYKQGQGSLPREPATLVTKQVVVSWLRDNVRKREKIEGWLFNSSWRQNWSSRINPYVFFGSD